MYPRNLRYPNSPSFLICIGVTAAAQDTCGDKNQFITIESKEDGGVVTFGDNGQGKIIDIGKIQINSTIFIDNVLHVNRLKHNLISINQLCDKGYTVSFGTIMCVITNPIDNSIIFIRNR